MNVKILESAARDLIEGWQFYECQEVGLGGYFSDTICSEIDGLQLYGGIHFQPYNDCYCML